MLSRVAESIYWASRYIERAENTARLVRVNTHLMLDTPKGVDPGWEPLIDIMGLGTQFTHCCKKPTERNIVRFLIGDQSNSSSILSSLQTARENFRTMREILPRSGWEKLNELFIAAKQGINSGLTKKGRDEFLNTIISGSQLLNGLLASSMYRDEAWHFMRIGRYLERADMTTRIIDVRSVDLLDGDNSFESRSFESVEWISILKSLSAYYNYSREVQVRVSKVPVLEFLLHDKRFPRSIAHGIGHIEESVGTLSNNDRSLKALRSIHRQVNQQHFESLDMDDLHRFLDKIQLGITDFHKSLEKQYFLTGL